MPPRKRRQAKALARYRDGATVRTSKRSRPNNEDQGLTEVSDVTPPGEIATLHEQLALMQQQIQSISDVGWGMASTTAATAAVLAASDVGERPPAAAAVSATTAEEDSDVSGCMLGEAQDELPFPCEMQSLSYVSLGSLVDAKIKAKIWAMQFVDLELLVGESAPQTMYLLDLATSRPVVQVRDQPTTEISNIEQWTDAFICICIAICIAIYTERHPNDTHNILKYMQLIRTMSDDTRPSLFMSMTEISASCRHIIPCLCINYINNCSLSSPDSLLLSRVPSSQ